MPNLIKKECDQWWFSHQTEIVSVMQELADNNLTNMTPLRTLLASRFEAGAAWSMRESARLNPYVSQFLEMCILLGGPRED